MTKEQEKDSGTTGSGTTGTIRTTKKVVIKKPRLDVEGNTKKRKSAPIVTVLEDKKKAITELR